MRLVMENSSTAQSVAPSIVLTEKDITRFWSKVDKGDGSGCWWWKGGKTGNGYGAFWFQGNQVATHRFCFEQFVRKLENPKNMVCHTCDNPLCVKPDHLWEGTATDNARDRSAKNRSFRPIGELSYLCKFTKEQVLEMRQLFRSGTRVCDIARKFRNTRLQVVWNIVHRKRWKHI